MPKNFRLFLLGIFSVAIIFSALFCRLFLEYPYEDKYYPFWSMDLFSKIKFQSYAYRIQLHQVDQIKFEKEISLYDFFQIKDTESFSPHILIEQMGVSLKAGDEIRYQKLKRDFEIKMFSKNKVVIYSLVRTHYNNLEKVKLNKDQINVVIRKEEYALNNQFGDDYKVESDNQGKNKAENKTEDKTEDKVIVESKKESKKANEEDRRK
jgi:hypothetical protein